MTRSTTFSSRALVGSRNFPLLVLCLTARGLAATITNYLGASGEWPLHSLALNVGDTVLWVSQQPGTNYVESYGGEWKSPVLNPNDSFSVTFTNAGFYAYRTGLSGPLSAGAVRGGVVAVKAWTGGPPLVTINTPIDGSINQSWLQSSVTNPEAIAEIQYFADSTFIGSAASPPYGIGWNTGLGPRTTYVLVAKAIDRQGGVAWSQPVNVISEKGYHLWGDQVLPTGEVLFFYQSRMYPSFIGSSDSLSFTSYDPLVANVIYSGVFVDETVRAGTVQRRFYGLIWGPPALRTLAKDLTPSGTPPRAE